MFTATLDLPSHLLYMIEEPTTATSRDGTTKRLTSAVVLGNLMTTQAELLF
jgi:hypothetical protein